MIAAAGCFLWGMISVAFSPCHLASIPLIVAYVGGQQQILKPREAVHYSVAFTLGLFTTIAAVGVICAILGRMLGDVGNYWQILVGLVLIWVALGMFGVDKCSMSGNFLYRLNLRGLQALLAWGLPTGFFPVPAPSGSSRRFLQSSLFKRRSPRAFSSFFFLLWGTVFPSSSQEVPRPP
jgi:cytochrome c-type biogenesis protein